MTRARRRQSRTMTADAEWQRRRAYVMAGHSGDDLLQSSEFWKHEPGVPDDLRTDPYHWRDLLAPPDVAADIRAKRAALLDARRAWLIEQGIR